MVLIGGMDTGWKPRGRRISEKSSLLSDDAAPSSSEYMSTTAGWRDVMCVRRTYAYSPQRCVASRHHRDVWLLVSISVIPSSCKTWAGRLPSTNHGVSSNEKAVREGRSNSRVSRWNMAVNLSSTTFVVGD